MQTMQVENEVLSERNWPFSTTNIPCLNRSFTYANLNVSYNNIKLMTVQEAELVQWLRGELCCKDKELFVVASQEVERSRTWSLDHVHSNGLTVTMPPEPNQTDPQLAFTAQGIKYIEDDSLSVENSLDVNSSTNAKVKEDRNGLVSGTCHSDDDIKKAR